MCIVSYLPTANGFCITSNRDEQIHRPTLKPKIYPYHDKKFVYPKDLQLGGTWFAIDPKAKRASCLLNAKSISTRKYPKISRGRLPIAWLEKGSDCFDVQMQQIAPFVLVTLDYSHSSPELSTYFWNGTDLKKERLANNHAHLWCSSSLYRPEKKEAFQKAFSSEGNAINNKEKVLDFHQKVAQPLNSEVYLEKDKDIKTVSITSLISHAKDQHLSYLDLQSKNPKFDGINLI